LRGMSRHTKQRPELASVASGVMEEGGGAIKASSGAKGRVKSVNNGRRVVLSGWVANFIGNVYKKTEGKTNQ